MAETLPEHWLRGPLPDVDPMVAPVLRSLEQALEDVVNHTEGLTVEQIWARPHGLAPLGFQLRHIAGSIDRLVTYLLGGQLDDARMAALRAEMEPGATREDLLEAVSKSMARAAEAIRSVGAGRLAEPRSVGRKRLPTTVIGLLVHIAEHTQRHVGQAIAAAKLARAVDTARR